MDNLGDIRAFDLNTSDLRVHLNNNIGVTVKPIFLLKSYVYGFFLASDDKVQPRSFKQIDFVDIVEPKKKRLQQSNPSIYALLANSSAFFAYADSLEEEFAW